MIEDDQIPAASAEDSQSDWKFISSLVLSVLSAVFCAVGSESFYYGLLIFFPVRRLVDGFLDNSSQKIAGGLLMMLIYLVFLNSVPMMTVRVTEALSGKKISSAEIRIAAGFLFSGLFLVAGMLTALAGKIVPKWKIPEKIHYRVKAVIYVFALYSSLSGIYYALDSCNGRFLSYPDIVGFLLILVLSGIGIASGWGIIRQTLNPPVKKKQTAQLLVTRPKTKLSDVAGMDDIKEQIRLRLIEPVKDPVKAKKYGLKTGGGVLLYGPPGTGKTFLARAIAGELNLPFYMITAADIFGKYVGESEQNIRELFRKARQNPLSVVFVDELENIFSKRSDDIHETTQKVISYILQELDGVDQHKNPILLLGATNTPWRIDEAFLRPGRFDILAFVDLPDVPARKQIIKAAFQQSTLPQEAGLIQYIADNTPGYSGADLNGLVAKIQQQAFRRGESRFTQQLAYEILLQSPPSPNREILAQLRSWEASRQGLS